MRSAEDLAEARDIFMEGHKIKFQGSEKGIAGGDRSCNPMGPSLTAAVENH